MKRYQNFLSENFQVFEVKFSLYLNRRVFVMSQISKSFERAGSRHTGWMGSSRHIGRAGSKTQ